MIASDSAPTPSAKLKIAPSETGSAVKRICVGGGSAGFGVISALRSGFEIGWTSADFFTGSPVSLLGGGPTGALGAELGAAAGDASGSGVWARAGFELARRAAA